MNFDAIWNDQMKFNRNFFNPETIRDNPEKFQQMNNFYCLAAHREISEARSTLFHGRFTGKSINRRLEATHWKN